MTTHTVPEELVQAFGSADCEHLAAELAARYQLDLVVVGDSVTGAWIHALAHHTQSNIYLDINGIHTFDEVLAMWDDYPDWDGVHDVLELPSWHLNQRHYPQANLTEAIAHVVHMAKEYGLDLVDRGTDTEPIRQKLGLNGPYLSDQALAPGASTAGPIVYDDTLSEDEVARLVARDQALLHMGRLARDISLLGGCPQCGHSTGGASPAPRLALEINSAAGVDYGETGAVDIPGLELEVYCGACNYWLSRRSDISGELHRALRNDHHLAVLLPMALERFIWGSGR